MSNFHIYRASAGSGKTFLLVRNYIKLLLANPHSYRHILAVTFTNKATNSMKFSILEELHFLATIRKSNHHQYMLESLGLTQTELRYKAQIALSNILHNYSYFNISTIDKFYVTVFESFIRELNIRDVSAIELDSLSVLNSSMKQLIEGLSSGSKVLSHLSSFMHRKIAIGKSWKIDEDIAKLGMMIFKEDFKNLYNPIFQKLKEGQSVEKFIIHLGEAQKQLEIQLISTAESVLALLAEHSLSQNDFKYKSTGIYGYFASFLKEWKTKRLIKPFGARIVKATETIDNCISPASREEIKQRIISIYSELASRIKKFIALFRQKQNLDIVSENIYILAILPSLLNEIKQHLDLCELIMITDIMALINRVIDNNNAPFIYEKTGNRIKHFLIDEFQDTSHLQWQNFLPLLHNSLSENNQVLLVGDIKQSIYRWRNSDWRIMGQLVEKDMQPWQPAYHSLQQNWRSSENIVAVNNRLYQNLCLNLESVLSEKTSEPYDTNLLKDIKNAYRDVQQQCSLHKKSKGNVRIKFFTESTKEPFQDKALEELTRVLMDCKMKNYKPSDIAILVRENKESQKIVQHFLSYNRLCPDNPAYNMVSNESFLLTKAKSIRILDQAMRYLTTKDAFYKYSFERLYSQYIPDNKQVNIDKVYDDLHFNSSLFELIEQLIYKLNLGTLASEYAYLAYFQDIFLAYYQQYHSKSLVDFLTYWDEKKDSLNIPYENDVDAVKILTIHKAKGLGFKVVIIPFCDWNINDFSKREIIWAQPKSEQASVPLVPINYRKGLVDSNFSSLYFQEKTARLMDSLNLLYVATTRAKENLFVLSNLNPKNSQTITTGYLLYEAIKRDDSDFFALGWNVPDCSFSLGNIADQSPAKTKGKAAILSLQEYSPYFTFDIKLQLTIDDFYKKHQITTLTPIDRGVIYHNILQGIFTKNDIDKAVNNAYIEGYISYSEIEFYKNKITALLTKDQLAGCFSSKWKVLNERWLIIDKNTKFRPDRLMIKDSHAVILDYKFGEKKTAAHLSQLLTYQRFLSTLNFTKVEAYLLYGLEGDLVKIA